MRGVFLILLVIGSVLLGIVIFVTLYSIPPIERGEFPKFEATLVDNGENDYIIYKYISSGTEFYKADVPLQVGETLVYVRWDNCQEPWPVDNLLPGESRWDNNLFEVRPFVSENLFPAENVKIAFNADVVQLGKAYHVFWMSRRDNRGFYIVNFGKTDGYRWFDLVAVENI